MMWSEILVAQGEADAQQRAVVADHSTGRRSRPPRRRQGQSAATAAAAPGATTQRRRPCRTIRAAHRPVRGAGLPPSRPHWKMRIESVSGRTAPGVVRLGVHAVARLGAAQVGEAGAGDQAVRRVGVIQRRQQAQALEQARQRRRRESATQAQFGHLLQGQRMRERRLRQSHGAGHAVQRRTRPASVLVQPTRWLPSSSRYWMNRMVSPSSGGRAQRSRLISADRTESTDNDPMRFSAPRHNTIRDVRTGRGPCRATTRTGSSARD